MKSAQIAWMTLLLSTTAIAQIGGNQIYNSNSNNYLQQSRVATPPRNSITTNGPDFTVSATVLINVKPNILMVTLGLNQEAKTVKQCNAAINKRIEGFTQKIKSLGTKDSDVYVDFITQTKIYDYEISGSKVQQIETGFEIKKNIIIRLSDVKAFSKLTDIASDFEIYDLVKAEYLNDDVEAVYARLFDEGIRVIEAKKQKYVKVFKINLSEDSNLVEDNYYSIQPKTQYREYKAFETADVDVSNYYNDTKYVRKEQRKNKTFYYQGIDTSTFDKVINPADPEVCLQYVAEMKVVYHVRR